VVSIRRVVYLVKPIIVLKALKEVIQIQSRGRTGNVELSLGNQSLFAIKAKSVTIYSGSKRFPWIMGWVDDVDGEGWPVIVKGYNLAKTSLYNVRPPTKRLDLSMIPKPDKERREDDKLS
jgi:hypothetical protein